jgi:hypothetical protein
VSLSTLSILLTFTQEISSGFQRFFNRASPALCRKLLPDTVSTIEHRVAKTKTLQQPTAESDKHGLDPNEIAAITQIESQEALQPSDYEDFWMGKMPAFTGCNGELFSRIGCLLQGIGKITNNRTLNSDAHRISYLFFYHEVEEVEISVREGETSRGRGAKTIALDKIADTCKKDRKALKTMYKMSRKYFAIAEAGGVGSLLLLGNDLTM